MSDLFLGLIKVNESVDYNSVFMLVIAYFIIFWLIISVWIFFDAKKRYDSVRKALVIFIFTLFFGIPFLIVYFLVRPIDGEELQEVTSGGVNVPIINFTGKDGVVMALELKINHSKFVQDEDTEMKIDVNFSSDDPNKKLTMPENLKKTELPSVNVQSVVGSVLQTSTGVNTTTEKEEVHQVKTKEGILITFKNKINSIKSKFENLKLKAKKKESKKEDTVKKTSENKQSITQEKEIQNQQKKKKNKKSRRR